MATDLTAETTALGLCAHCLHFDRKHTAAVTAVGGTSLCETCLRSELAALQRR